MPDLKPTIIPQVSAFPALGAAMLILGLLILAFINGGARLAALAGVGTFAGIALYHASFGFTAAWRRFITDGKSAGLRAQFVMLGVASLVFFPALGAGEIFGRPVGGFVFPVGVALIAGAFLFGIGMQIGGGCGSGTLFTIGGGSLRMVVTLLFFILGSTIATAWADIWFAWPALPPYSVIATFGTIPALLGMLAVLALLYFIVGRIERLRNDQIPPINAPASRWLAGPWSLIAGALALAGVNIATLLLNGWPWGITSAFALWGAKGAALIGFSPADWTFWKWQGAALATPVLADTNSIMDFGIILGAMLAAILAGKFRPGLAIPLRSLLAAILGGLLLGIGARLGTGCNIGAFFSGTVSGSLHGWVWLGAAFAGNIIGVKLRPLFHLD